MDRGDTPKEALVELAELVELDTVSPAGELHRAASVWGGYEAVVRLLLERGADHKAVNNYG